MSWRQLESAAPELASSGKERLTAVGIALLATVRPDGWPRISPVEPHFVDDELVFAAMPWSLKARDLARDPRCTLHSAVTDPDSGDSELKLYGRAASAEDDAYRDAAGAWWTGRPPEEAHLFALEIAQAALVSWDTARGEMTVRRWSPGRGEDVSRRAYP